MLVCRYKGKPPGFFFPFIFFFSSPVSLWKHLKILSLLCSNLFHLLLLRVFCWKNKTETTNQPTNQQIKTRKKISLWALCAQSDPLTSSFLHSVTYVGLTLMLEKAVWTLQTQENSFESCCSHVVSLNLWPMTPLQNQEVDWKP